MYFFLFICAGIIIFILASYFDKRNQRIRSKPIEIEPAIPDNEISSFNTVPPDTDNEFRFYEFVSSFEYIDQYYEQCEKLGYTFRPEYIEAIEKKIRYGFFKNPLSFPEYFDSKFDYVAIDFETANNNRISACAIGIACIKEGKLVHSFKKYIKPPSGQSFLSTHTNIHGISSSDVINAPNFKELWNNDLVKYFPSNLIICHNTSMDISVISQLATYYKIDDFELEYVDTMAIANGMGLPLKIHELAKHFDLEAGDAHDPKADAELCAEIFNQLQDITPDIFQYRRRVFPAEVSKPTYKNSALKVKGGKQYNQIIRKHRVKTEDKKDFVFNGAAFLVTGELSEDRDSIHSTIESFGGVIKKSVSSKLDYVVVGDDYGWSKILKVQEYNEAGKASIKFLNEEDFYSIIPLQRLEK